MTDGLSEAELGQLNGEKARVEFKRAGIGPWTVLYDGQGIGETPVSATSYSVLAPPSLRADFLGENGWDARIGDGRPGMVTTNGDEESTTYLPFGNDEGWEPLVIVTDAAGTRDSEIIFNQEFRLVFELFEDRRTGDLIDVRDDGSEVVVVKFSERKVTVRTSYLARFRALKQLDLWLYTDVIAHFPDISAEHDFEQVTTEWKSEDSAGFNSVGTTFGYLSSLFMAKKFFAPPPIEQCNLWQYEDRSKNYENFIIGEDEFGKTVTFTCEEAELGNYFGKNPEAPHYLTPVFFRTEVLQKYYNNGELYCVTAGSISCRARWYLRVDNDHPEYVAVFLGDLGRDLPEPERQYWKGFNIAPPGPMSSTYARRSYLGHWVDAEQPDHQFKQTYGELQDQWQNERGWQLFRQPHDIDQGILNKLHVPLNESQIEFEDQLLVLAKLLVDFLNEKGIVKIAGRGPEGERGLGKLERFFGVLGYEHVQEDMALLRQIQELRSKVSAHSKGSDYDSYIAGKLGDKTKKEFVRDLHRRSTVMLKRWIELPSIPMATAN
ncbi:hypothetical protein ABIE37_000098 [Arthrobacter bambusae]|uniref:ApeA N-terminal domain-containing protein n=1 Tax=Arthrobacter bambusae TaxID=1338426 RepID=A0ABV2P0Q8_9MICC